MLRFIIYPLPNQAYEEIFMKRFQHFKSNGELSHWDNLLKLWLSLIKRYCSFMGDDVPFYYSERANIGVLAGAAWVAGWVALEEFGAKKRGKERGRSDLYIFPKEKENGEYIEVKHLWIGITLNEQKMVDIIERAIDKSVKDARELIIKKDEAAIKIGVTFICPFVHKRFKSEMDLHIHKFIQTVSEISCNSFAYIFPDEARELMIGTYIYPGVALLARAM